MRVDKVMRNKQYCLQWKDQTDFSKGTIWTYMESDAFNHAGIPRSEDGMSRFQKMGGHRPTVCMRGTKWEATWEDGTTFTIRSSPQATKPVMASIALRWANPPKQLKRDGGQPFAVETLKTSTDAYVYLVRLLTFEPTASGASYFKIGKAVSIPNRIKQFGPCELIAHEVHTDPGSALKRETALHSQFKRFRRPDTEIFLMTQQELNQVVTAMNPFKA